MLSEKPPPATCWLEGGSCRSGVLRTQSSPGAEAVTINTWLVRLISNGRGCRSGVRVSELSAGEEAGPASDAEVLRTERTAAWSPVTFC